MRILLFLALLGFQFQSSGQYIFNNVVSNLKYPISIDLDPNGNIYVALKGGTATNPDSARVDVYSPAGIKIGMVWDFTDSVEAAGEQGVLGVALDPDFTNNNFVYVYYNHDNPDKVRVMRFTMSGGIGTNPLIILEIDDSFTANNHVGGNIHFRPSEPDKIYVALGERAVPANAQLLTNPWGKILRINSDGSIPTDNPFYDDGDPTSGNDDRIWSFGHRNPFDFTFASNDSLYSSENGQNEQDEVNLIYAAGNYGWPECEGVMNYYGNCSDSGLLAPLDIFGPVGANLPSVTGIVFYEDSVLPVLTNHLLVSTYIDGTVRALEMGNPPAYDTVLSAQTLFSGQFGGLTDIAVNASGCLYVVDGGYTSTGSIVEICPDGVGIKELQSFNINLVPNPTDHTLRIQSNNELLFVMIYTIDGHFVRDFTNVDQTVDVSFLESGIYLVYAVDVQNRHSVQKLIKR